MFLPHIKLNESVSVATVEREPAAADLPLAGFLAPPEYNVTDNADPVSLSTGRVIVADGRNQIVTHWNVADDAAAEMTAAEYDEFCAVRAERREAKRAAEYAAWNARREAARNEWIAARSPAPPADAGESAESAEQFSGALLTRGTDDTFDDFERRESAVVCFGRQLEASRVATIQDVRYCIKPAETGSGFAIEITGADGFTETIVSGIYGFAFETFGRTLDYAVQRARGRFVCHPETLDSNGCQIERRYHKRRACWVYVVTLSEPLPGSRFSAQETRAKRAGGWYAREYKPEFQRGGFMFLNLRDAETFARDFKPSGKVATMRRCENPPSEGFSEAAGNCLRIITTDTGYFRGGLRGGAVLTGSRTVFIGPIGSEVKTEVAEFTVTIDGSTPRPFCQIGRDFVIDADNGGPDAVTGGPSEGFSEADEIADAETRVRRLSPRAGQSAAKWTVDGFNGTSGPPTVFDRKRDAVEYAVNNRRAVSARISGNPGRYEPFVYPGPDSLQLSTGPAPQWLRDEAHRQDNSAATRTAEKLESLADGMQKTIDEKTRPLSQNWTVKRGREYAHRVREGEQLQRCQFALRTLAALWRNGEIPDTLAQLKTKSAVLPLVAHGSVANRNGEYSDSGEYSNKSPEAVLLHSLMAQHRTGEQSEAIAARQRQKTIDAATDRLRHCCDGVPGFFPTPAAFAKTLTEWVAIPDTPSDDFFVLEPSAGIGSLCDAVAAECPAVAERIDCVERWEPAADVLELKGYAKPHRVDFLTIDPDKWGRQYDRIIMNPPFETLQDINHVLHAWQFLKPGGRLVAIMSAGSFYSTTRNKVLDFVDWVSSVGGWYVPAADGREEHRGAFQGSDAFRQTGVSVRIVVLDKPE